MTRLVLKEQWRKKVACTLCHFLAGSFPCSGVHQGIRSVFQQRGLPRCPYELE